MFFNLIHYTNFKNFEYLKINFKLQKSIFKKHIFHGIQKMSNMEVYDLILYYCSYNGRFNKCG